MWPFLEYFDRKIHVHHIGFFEPQIIFWRHIPFFLDVLEYDFVLEYDRKAPYGFARKSPTTFGATKGTKRANSKTSSVLCLLDRCGAPIWISMRSASHHILEMWCAHINLVARNADVMGFTNALHMRRQYRVLLSCLYTEPFELVIEIVFHYYTTSDIIRAR